MIDNNGAPTGERHFIFYNPPVVNRQLGIRKGSVQETKAIASTLLNNGVQTIVFAKSRLIVEVLTRHLKDMVRDPLGNAGRVRGYRGGYLPSERRDIESGLRRGVIDAVVSTNALELGIDIGALEACVLCGYPGTISSTWQQAGRAGRRKGTSVMVMVASSAAIDQYIVTHPHYFFSQSPEHALLNPDNLYVLLSHFKCAAYELPFEDGETFGNVASTQELLDYLAEENILRHVEGRYHWMAEDFPASEISLRSAASENYLIVDITNPAHHRVIGEMDRYTVPMLLHENAIYMHEAQQYQVEKLDFDGCKAFIRQVDVDYYTDADLNISLSLLDIAEEKGEPQSLSTALGEVKVTTLVKMFKKMKLDTHENLGFGPVRLPETDMHTTAMWWTLPDNIANKYGKDELQSGMLGVSNLLRIVAPLYLMCSPRDISVIYQVKGTFTQKPTLFVYDNSPGGIGLAEKCFTMQSLLLNHALDIVSNCDCKEGCPSCAGPVGEIGSEGKKASVSLLKEMIACP
jgi:DEAD/DEAH box helicase domain-containing protein